MPGCALTQFAPPPVLIQIRRGLSTVLDNFRLRVEADTEGWQARVLDRQGNRELYTARRCSARAAKVAATEFALFRTAATAPGTPETVAQQLAWQEYW
jgi:hypothetical protein